MTLTAQTSPPSSVRPDVKGRFLRVVAGLMVAASATILSTGAGATGTAATTVNEVSNDRVVTVRPGTNLTAILHSTYWSIDPLSGNAVLAQVGATKTVGKLKGCVPGQGCGTVSAHFVARGAGQVRLRAHRTSCGEALRCTPSQSHWTVVIRVR